MSSALLAPLARLSERPMPTIPDWELQRARARGYLADICATRKPSNDSAAREMRRAGGAGAAQGGVIRAGTGITNAAGQAFGATGTRLVGSIATGAGAIGRQGYGIARTAAYKLAALRGRA